jgi:hypothetical protein
MAIQRLFDYYAHTAITANNYLVRYPSMLDATSFAPPQHAPEIRTRRQASAWMETELANLQAISEPSYATAIAAATADFLLTAGAWEQAESLHLKALDNARNRDDLIGQAVALTKPGKSPVSPET